MLTCSSLAHIISPLFSTLQLTEKDVYLSYLPLAHIFDRVIEETFIWHGASIGFWRGVSICNKLVVTEL